MPGEATTPWQPGLNDSYDSMGAPTARSGAWSYSNPSEIVALNNRYEASNNSQKIIFTDNCPSPLIDGQTCQLPAQKWPSATFEFPQGMPNTVFTKPDTLIKIIDAKKGVTTFRTTIINTSSDARYPQYRPLLSGIKFPGATSESVNFFYNSGSIGVDNGFVYAKTNLSAASGTNGTTTFNNSSPDQWNISSTISGSDASATMDNSYYGGMVSAVTIDGLYSFKNGSYVTSTWLYGEPRKSFIYDTRNNVTEIRTLNNAGNSVLSRTVATYPASCTEDILKTCNKPLTIKDNNGNITTYTYHIPSGQVESVTSPLVGTLRAQTRYEYTAKTASASQIANSPIYLKTKESTCANSNFSGSGDGYSRFTGTCASNDEVVTTYEYEPNNLLLKGILVTGDGKSQRTCFSYDQYGNQIGKTLPQAFLTLCP